MPDAPTHSRLTAAALRAAGIEAPELVQCYCLYPDDYYSRPKEIKPYLHFLEGIPFHYLPDISYNEMYRYWDVDENGKAVQCRSFRNDNYRHALSGFRFTFRKVRAALRHGKRSDAEKFLGVLMHTLEDAAFALHALEGAGGADIYALDRLSGKPVLRTLVSLNAEGLTASEYTPQFLGPTPELAAMRLYAEYTRRCRDSRHAMFQLALPLLAGVKVDEKALRQRMFDNAVQLAADAAYTAFRMPQGGRVEPFALDALEPVRFPLGGMGEWRLRGAVIRPGLIAFGVNYEQHMHFDIAPGYRTLAGRLRWRGCTPGTILHAAFRNCGKVVSETELSSLHPEAEITLENPCGLCGVDLTAEKLSGTFEMEGFMLK